MQDPIIGWSDRQPAGDSLRLTRALAQDLRASVHGLRMALEMAAGELAPGEAGRFLGLARAEADQLDRTVEQLGLWVRLLAGDVKIRLQRVDLAAAVAERPDGGPAGGGRTHRDQPVFVLADRSLLAPALDGLRDFLNAYALPREHAGVRVHPDGELELFGPLTLLPVLRAIVDNPVPDLGTARGPAVWLVGPSLAVAACRASDGTVWLERNDTGCSLWLAWRPAGGV